MQIISFMRIPVQSWWIVIELWVKTGKCRSRGGWLCHKKPACISTSCRFCVVLFRSIRKSHTASASRKTSQTTPGMRYLSSPNPIDFHCFSQQGVQNFYLILYKSEDMCNRYHCNRNTFKMKFTPFCGFVLALIALAFASPNPMPNPNPVANCTSPELEHGGGDAM